MRYRKASGKQPRLRRLVLRFKRLNVVGVLQGQADFIETVKQAVLAMRRDVETEALAAGQGHGLRLQVDL